MTMKYRFQDNELVEFSHTKSGQGLEEIIADVRADDGVREMIETSLNSHDSLVRALETLKKWFERKSENGEHHNSPDFDFFDGSMEGFIQKHIVEAKGQTWKDYCNSIAEARGK